MLGLTARLVGMWILGVVSIVAVVLVGPTRIVPLVSVGWMVLVVGVGF